MYTKLSIGDSGNEVKRLKSKLKSLNYSIPNEDEHFDERTRIAVLSFQNDCGIKINGIADEKTWSAILNVMPDTAFGGVVTGQTSGGYGKSGETTGYQENEGFSAVGKTDDKIADSGAEPNKKTDSSADSSGKNDAKKETVIEKDVAVEKDAAFGKDASTDKDAATDKGAAINKEPAIDNDVALKKDSNTKKDVSNEKDIAIAYSGEAAKNLAIAPEGTDTVAAADCDAVPGMENRFGFIDNIPESDSLESISENIPVSFEPSFSPDKNNYVVPLVEPEMNDYIDSVVNSGHNTPEASRYGGAFEPDQHESDGTLAGSYSDPYLTPEADEYSDARSGHPQDGNAFDELKFIPIDWEHNKPGYNRDDPHGNKRKPDYPQDHYPGHGSPGGIPPGLGEPTLRLGSTGESVIILQRKLQALGFYRGTIDGIFGMITENAVKAFQSSNSLVPNGIVGNFTWNAINSALSGIPSAPCHGSRPALREGSKGAHVSELQTILRDLGYYRGRIDGFFGSETANAVRFFQKDNGLIPDGIVNSLTWEVLYRSGGRHPNDGIMY